MVANLNPLSHRICIERSDCGSSSFFLSVTRVQKKSASASLSARCGLCCTRATVGPGLCKRFTVKIGDDGIERVTTQTCSTSWKFRSEPYRRRVLSSCCGENCNYRIGAPVLLNRCCAFQPELESIFLAEMLKILLQHNRGQTGKHVLFLSITGFDPEPT
jgi:hypothetical protein